MAGATGLEPATYGVTGRHSNQLSYAPAGAFCGQSPRKEGRCRARALPSQAGDWGLFVPSPLFCGQAGIARDFNRPGRRLRARRLGHHRGAGAAVRPSHRLSFRAPHPDLVSYCAILQA